MRERWQPDLILRRLPGLYAGPVTFGMGIALMAQSGLGLGLVQVLLGFFDRDGRISRRRRVEIGEPGSMPGE